MAQDAPRRRSPRPVADAPIDGLLAQTEELAREWGVALLRTAPLHAAPTILTEAFARDAPRICDAALRALVEDSDLRRLAPGGALRRLAGEAGVMTGAAGAAAGARAVDQLHEALWSGLEDDLRSRHDAGLVADVAARLAAVTALIREAVLERDAGRPPDGLAAIGEPDPVIDEPLGEDGGPGRERTPEAPWAPDAATVAGGAATPLWLAALEDELRAAQAGGRSLSLLLAELEDADRLLAAAGAARAGAALEDFVTALRRVLRRRDILVWESDARAWVIARDTARAAAHSLGARIAESVGETDSLGGAPLVASVGIAVLGEDGEDSAALIEAAEEARFAASARGIEVSRRAPERERRG